MSRNCNGLGLVEGSGMAYPYAQRRCNARRLMDLFVQGINDPDPERSADLISSLFAEDGIWVFDDSHVTGPAAVRAVALGYETNGGEHDQSVVIESFSYDQETCMGVVEWTWTATTDDDRPKMITPCPTCTPVVQVPGGQTYRQSDACMFKTTCDGKKLLYWREYFNNAIVEAYYVTPPGPAACPMRPVDCSGLGRPLA